MGGGCLPSSPDNYQAGSYSFIITNPTLAGERMLLILKVSILSEQTNASYMTCLERHLMMVELPSSLRHLYGVPFLVESMSLLW